MKKAIIYFILGTLFTVSISFIKAENSTKKIYTNELLNSNILMLNGIKVYTLEMAEAMPAEKYTFRPTDSVRSFGEQMAHIASSSKFLLNVFVKGEPMPSSEDFAKATQMEKELGASKEACIKALNESFDTVKTAMESMDAESLHETFIVPFDPNKPEFTKEKAFEFIKDHLIHHRAQALVSLRMQGIKAPQYRLY